MTRCNKEDCKKDGTLRCSRCKKFNYCSKECQTSDWKKHKKQCKKPEEKGSPSNDNSGNVAGPGTAPKKTSSATDQQLSAVNEFFRNLSGYGERLTYIGREELAA